MWISELYGMKIISVDGRNIGNVQEVILDLENGEIAHVLITKLEEIKRSGDIGKGISKSSIAYKRVRSIGETIVVGNR